MENDRNIVLISNWADYNVTSTICMKDDFETKEDYLDLKVHKI
jgi:hypothetical protein